MNSTRKVATGTDHPSAEVATFDAGMPRAVSSRVDDHPADVDAARERIVPRVVVEEREVFEPGDCADKRREAVDQSADDGHADDHSNPGGERDGHDHRSDRCGLGGDQSRARDRVSEHQREYPALLLARGGSETPVIARAAITSGP